MRLLNPEVAWRFYAPVAQEIFAVTVAPQ